jgi:hypothetical protein
MNIEDAIRMAEEAGLLQEWMVLSDDQKSKLERFAALVAAAEREALEKFDWTAILRSGGLVTWGDAADLGDRVIATIRTRGQE